MLRSEGGIRKYEDGSRNGKSSAFAELFLES